MQQPPGNKISVSLPRELLEYAERYQLEHNLASRSEVIALAVRALREHELTEAYRALAEEYRQRPDPLLELGIADGLEQSDGSEWL